jgi:hypothetical protein
VRRRNWNGNRKLAHAIKFSEVTQESRRRLVRCRVTHEGKMIKDAQSNQRAFWLLLLFAMLPFFLLILQVTLERVSGFSVAVFDNRMFLITILCGMYWLVMRR